MAGAVDQTSLLLSCSGSSRALIRVSRVLPKRDVAMTGGRSWYVRLLTKQASYIRTRGISTVFGLTLEELAGGLAI
jgi:hypothetical protein